MGHGQAQSTDLKDVTGYRPAGHEGGHDREVDERGPDWAPVPSPGPIARDAHSRVVGVETVGERTRILIAIGPAQGVYAGMSGYVIDHQGQLYDFEIDDVRGGCALAFVDNTVHEMQGGVTAVVNPSARPTPVLKHDIHTRVTGDSVEGDHVRILLPYGKQQGVTYGTRGHLVDDSGTPVADFVIDAPRDNSSSALVKATTEIVRAHKSVVLNPSH